MNRANEEGSGAPRRNYGLLFILLSFLALAIFILIEHRQGGFEALRRYGADFADGINWVNKIAPRERIFFSALLTTGLSGLILLGLGLHRLAPGSLWRKTGDLLFRSDRRKFVIVCSLFVFLLTQSLTIFVFHQTGITDDEEVYLFQARIFASGRLYMDSPPHREFFDNIFLINNGRMYGQYPPGHSLILAPGVILGHVRLIPSMLAALTVPLIFHIGLMLRGGRTGRVAALLLCFSPFFAFTSSTLFSGTSSLFLLTLALWAGVRSVEEDGGPGIAFLAGAAGGMAFMVKPSTAFIFLLPMYAYIYFKYLTMPEGRFRMAAALTAGGVLLLGAYLWFNWAMNGHPLVTGYQVMWADKVGGAKSPFGFGKFLWGIEHTPGAGLRNTLLNLLRLNFWLFGLPLSLALPAAGVAARRKNPWEWIFTIIVVLAFGLYFFYFWSGVSDTGPILYYEMLTPLVLLSAFGCVRIDDVPFERKDESARRVLHAFSAAALMVSLAFFWQVQVRVIGYLVKGIEEPYRVVGKAEVGRAMIFMEYYLKSTNQRSWVAGRRNNSPALDDEVLYVKDLGLSRNRELIEAYPDRTPYRFRYIGDEPVLIPHGPIPAQRRFIMGDDGTAIKEQGNGIQREARE